MKNSDFFQTDTCLTEERMLNYLQGKLSPSEQHLVEKHLLDCELCSDAMEGLQLMKDPSALKGINEEIKAKIEDSLIQEEMPVVKVMFPWRIAAAFALIFVSAATLWIVLPKTNTEKLFTQEYKPYPSPAETESPASLQESTPIEIESKKNSAPPATKIKDLENNQPADYALTGGANEESDNKLENISSDEKAVATTSAPSAAINEESEVANAKIAEGKSKKSEVSTSGGTQSTGNESDRKKATKDAPPQPEVATSKRNEDVMTLQSKESPGQDYYNEGMHLYEEEKYLEAASLFDKETTKPEALFFSGVSYLSSDQPHLAIKKLKEYRKSKNTTYLEASWWYEGLANLKLDKKKDASAAFKEVVKLKGEHAEKAQELLKKL